MLTLRQIVMTVVLLFVMIVITPSAVAAIDITQDDWDEQFNESKDDADPVENDYNNLYGGNKELDVAAVNVTDSKVRFKTNISGGGLDSENGLQVYIDSDPTGDVGLDTDTVTGSLATYFDGLDAMNADYRVSVTDTGVPIIQEHLVGTSYETLQRIDIEEDNDQIVLEIDRETIGDPDQFQAKFAYAEKITRVDKKSNFVWAPKNPVKLPEPEVVENAEVNATVEFGDEKLDDTLSSEVVFQLTNDGEVVRDSKNSTYDGNGVINTTFTENIDNLDGEVKFKVEVNGDSNYSTDREGLNNSVTISENGLTAQKYDGYIALSNVEAGVTFGDEPTDDTTVTYTLKEGTKGKAEDSNFVKGEDTPLNQTFTVNPYNFRDSGGLEVDVDDEDYPLKRTKSITAISEGESLTSIDGSHLNFDADTIGHKFTLNNTKTSANFDDDDGFTTEVYLESIKNNDGKNITQVDHEIEFSDDLVIKDVNYVDAYPGDVQSIETDGVFDISLTNLSQTSNGVVTTGNNETLYEIDFEFKDDVQSDTPQGESNAREFSPSTVNEETALFNFSNTDTPGNPSFTSSTTSPTKVTNQNTVIKGVTVTHRTEGSDMVNTPTEFTVDVQSNDGEIAYITLNETDDGSVGMLPDRSNYDDNLVKDCEGASDCSAELRYTPMPGNNTFAAGGGYNSKFEFNITVVDSDGNKYYVPNEPNEISQSDLTTDIHKFGDVTGQTAPNPDSFVTASDVREILFYVGEDGGLPWGGDLGPATADINNDGEVTMNDVTLVYEAFKS